MLRNYFLVAYRHLVKNKLFSFINVFGLAIGLASFMILQDYVAFERSYDQFNRDVNQIYRVESIFWKDGIKTDHFPTSSNGYGSAMLESFPEITNMTRINWNNSDRMVRYEEHKFRENHVCFVDSNFFEFFDYPIIDGDPSTFLEGPNKVVISASAAKKYFGNENPMGKRLQISTFSDAFDCEVTGVFADLPINQTMQFDILISWLTSPQWIWDFWYIHESYTYVKLREGSDPNTLEAQFPKMAEKFKTRKTLKDHEWAIDLVPMKDIHLNEAKKYEIETKGNRKAVQFIFVISIVILVIAWVNYINLSTAKSIERAKEVGIRKVAGSQHRQLVAQFLTEAFLVNMLAGILACIMILLISWRMHTFLDTDFSISIFQSPPLMVLFVIVLLVGPFLSGLYPAVVLSTFKPSVILKGKFITSSKGRKLRQGLVVLQFAISIILIGSTMLVQQQIQFMQNQDPGINIERTLVIEAPTILEDYNSKLNAFQNEVLQLPNVRAVTKSGAVPGKEVAKFLANRREYTQEEDQLLYEMLMADFDYIDAYGLEIVAGRNFDKDRPSDSTALILNESAVRQFGFQNAEEAIEQNIILEVTQHKKNKIIGVIKDYHQQSMQKGYTPIILFMDPDYAWIPITYISVSLQQGNPQQVIDQIEARWELSFPESSFDFFFLNEFYANQYRTDKQFGSIFSYFSILAIFIACLGLFGLTLFMAIGRTKEIGVRKVLGGSVIHVIGLLNIETFKLLLLSSAIGIPIWYLFMRQWLSGYAFKVSLEWWMFLQPIFVVLLIALITTSFITIKAALAQPSKSLRYE